MITAIEKGGGGKQMYLHSGPFRWSCRGVEAIRSTSPDAACPGLLRKTLDSAIGLQLVPYCPGGRQGDNQQNDDAAVQYCVHCPMEEARGFHKSH